MSTNGWSPNAGGGVSADLGVREVLVVMLTSPRVMGVPRSLRGDAGTEAHVWWSGPGA